MIGGKFLNALPVTQTCEMMKLIHFLAGWSVPDSVRKFVLFGVYRQSHKKQFVGDGQLTRQNQIGSFWSQKPLTLNGILPKITSVLKAHLILAGITLEEKKQRSSLS